MITLDIEMPRMDGLTFLQKIMAQHPIPVVICSSLAEEGAQSTLKALEYGAVDIITKPRWAANSSCEESQVMLCQAVKAAAAARHAAAFHAHRRTQADRRFRVLASDRDAMIETTEKIVAIGASTGGTEALQNSAGSPARGRSRHGDRAAHAGDVYAGVRQPAGQSCARFP